MGDVAGIASVLPVFNGERYLRAAVESVLSQTRPADEVIAVDDGSTDGTPGSLASYGGRVRVLRLKNGGVGAARNAGLRAARSPWVAFLDADDLWRPEKLELYDRAARRTPEAVLFFSDAVIIGADGEPRGTLSRRPDPGPLYPQLVSENLITTSTAMVRRETAIEAGGFREDFLCPAGVEDWEFFLRLARKGAGVHVPQPLTVYRVHPGSAIQTKRFDLKKDALRVMDLQEGVPEWSPRLRSLGVSRVCFDSGVRHLAAGDGAEARRDFRESLLHPRFFLMSAACWAASFLSAAWLGRLRRWRRRKA